MYNAILEYNLYMLYQQDSLICMLQAIYRPYMYMPAVLFLQFYMSQVKLLAQCDVFKPTHQTENTP